MTCLTWQLFFSKAVHQPNFSCTINHEKSREIFHGKTWQSLGVFKDTVLCQLNQNWEQNHRIPTVMKTIISKTGNNFYENLSFFVIWFSPLWDSCSDKVYSALFFFICSSVPLAPRSLSSADSFRKSSLLFLSLRNTICLNAKVYHLEYLMSTLKKGSRQFKPHYVLLVPTTLVAWLGFGIQTRCKAPSVLWVK